MKQPINFEEIIDNKVFARTSKDRDRTKDPDNKFSPSSAGYCERQMFITKAGLKKFDRIAIGSMKSGSLLHEWIEIDIQDKGLLEQDVKIQIEDPEINPHGIYFEGTYDFFDHTFLYDFKSTSNLNYCINTPSDLHKDQLIVYMAALGIEKGFIVYIDKRNLKAKQHLVDFDKQRLIKIFKKASKVYQAYMDWKNNGRGEIPFKKCGCNFCHLEETK